METAVFPERHVRFKTLDPPRPRQMHGSVLNSRTARQVSLAEPAKGQFRATPNREPGQTSQAGLNPEEG